MNCKYLVLSLLLLVFSSAHAQPLKLHASVVADTNDGIWQPIQVLPSPVENDSRIFIVSHNGLIHIHENGEVLSTPFLDIRHITDFGINGSENGMFAMAFDPDYATNRYIYVSYNGLRPDSTGNLFDIRLVCYQVDENNANLVDTTQWSEVIAVEKEAESHNGGDLHFGQDGFLYMSFGDGGYPEGKPAGIYSQDLNSLLGKIIRIDVNGMDPYTIPEDNPFYGQENVREEIWHYGLRNPWRFSSDINGDMYIGDVGEDKWEEVSFAPAGVKGLNYGWKIYEGNHCILKNEEECDTTGLTWPIHEYFHDRGQCAVIGGYVYRGKKFPEMTGFYIYGDGCGFPSEDNNWKIEKFKSLKKWDGVWHNTKLEITWDVQTDDFDETLMGFGTDQDGEIYICSRNHVMVIDELLEMGDTGEDTVLPIPFSINLDINSSQAIFRFDSWDQQNDLTIFDLSGKKVFEMPISTNSTQVGVDLSFLRNGIYQARYTSGKSSVHLKFSLIH